MNDIRKQMNLVKEGKHEESFQMNEGFMDTMKDMATAAKLGKELPVMVKKAMDKADLNDPESVKKTLGNALKDANKKIMSSFKDKELATNFSDSFFGAIETGLKDQGISDDVLKDIIP